MPYLWGQQVFQLYLRCNFPWESSDVNVVIITETFAILLGPKEYGVVEWSTAMLHFPGTQACGVEIKVRLLWAT